jgi:hypothetical protein
VQGYNCQIAVEENFQLIVGQALTQQANDKEQLELMIQTIEEQAGQKPVHCSIAVYRFRRRSELRDSII